MKYKPVYVPLVFIFLLALGSSASIPVTHAGFGPSNDLQIFYYADDTSLYGALKAREIDLSFWEVTPAQYQDAINDLNILLAPVPRFDYRAFSLNLNETIEAYANVKSPITIPEFRKAIHRLSNVEYYTNTICQGFSTKLPVTIAAPSSGWFNQSVVNFVEGRATGRYPYPYDALTFSRDAARALLDNAGFVDLEPDGIRNYPADWHGRPNRPNLDPLKFSIRMDDVLRKAAGLDLAAELEAIGVPVEEMLQNFPAAYNQVMSKRNYHIYTAGWSVGRFPTYLYSFFHSTRWFPGGSNYHMSTTPRYTDIDLLVDRVQYPPSYADAMKAAKDAQYLLTEKYTVMIPLWSGKAFYPFRNDLLGVTNYQAVGPENDYTYLKTWRISSGPLRTGLKAPPLEINHIYSRWFWDVETMGPFMAGFISNPPYNIMVDQPWLAQDWSSPPGTWFDGAVEKSKVTYWFRDDSNDALGDRDAEWIEPITGNVLADFTPQWLSGGGYEFNNWYFASEPAGWIYSGYRDIHHIRVYPSEKKAEVYFDAFSYWSMYWPYGRLLYRPAWLESPLVIDGDPDTAGTQPVTKSFTKADVDASGFVKTTVIPYRVMGSIVEVINMTVDGAPLTKSSGVNNNDYEIVKGKLKFYNLGSIPSAATIIATYWARGDPAGYAPGSLYYPGTSVGKVWIGGGTHYVTEHVPGAGGWTTYKKNPHYFLETPPKGEVDFWWYWNNGPQPRTGYYVVDILDVVKSTWALDGQGYMIPSQNWEPGTDLTWPGGVTPKGKTTIHDNTIVTGLDWAKTFGSPPP